MESSPFPMYRVFGLNLACALPSAVDFGLLKAQVTVAPDAVMHFGKVPDQLEDVRYSNNIVMASAGAVIVSIPGVAKYFIRNGNEIIIDAVPGAQDGDIATYGFGTALGTLLYQRGVLVLHGSAVGTSGGAVIFTGDKGAGKSTTASALALRHCEFLSDDVCALYLGENAAPVLHPGLARSKIAADSYLTLLKCAPDSKPVSPVLNKYAAPFSSSRDPRPVKAICLLEKENTPPHVQEITGATKLPLLVANIYRPMIHALTDLPKDRFIQISSVASTVRFFRATRPEGFSSFDAFIRLIEEQILCF